MLRFIIAFGVIQATSNLHHSSIILTNTDAFYFDLCCRETSTNFALANKRFFHISCMLASNQPRSQLDGNYLLLSSSEKNKRIYF